MKYPSFSEKLSLFDVVFNADKKFVTSNDPKVEPRTAKCIIIEKQFDISVGIHKVFNEQSFNMVIELKPSLLNYSKGIYNAA